MSSPLRPVRCSWTSSTRTRPDSLLSLMRQVSRRESPTFRRARGRRPAELRWCRGACAHRCRRSATVLRRTQTGYRMRRAPAEAFGTGGVMRSIRTVSALAGGDGVLLVWLGCRDLARARCGGALLADGVDRVRVACVAVGSFVVARCIPIFRCRARCVGRYPSLRAHRRSAWADSRPMGRG